MANPIEAAVLPLKAAAVERAADHARKTINHVTAELAACGNDLHVAAPYPSGNMGKHEYMVKVARYRLFENLTTWREHQSVGMNTPCYADIDPEKCGKFIEAARKDAAEQYDLFVAKLNQKIGVATTARLEGNHVWSCSFLYVTTPFGNQCWKTQQIINQSKYGKLFSQFPTRKVKGKA